MNLRISGLPIGLLAKMSLSIPGGQVWRSLIQLVCRKNFLLKLEEPLSSRKRDSGNEEGCEKRKCHSLSFWNQRRQGASTLALLLPAAPGEAQR